MPCGPVPLVGGRYKEDRRPSVQQKVRFRAIFKTDVDLLPYEKSFIKLVLSYRISRPHKNLLRIVPECCFEN